MRGVENLVGVFDTEQARIIGVAAKGTTDVSYFAAQDTPTTGVPVTAVTDPVTGGVGILAGSEKMLLDRRYGRSSGKVRRCVLTGRTITGGAVTTPLYNNTTTTVPLAERDIVIGLIPSANGITVPAGLSPAEYRIRFSIRISGSEANKFEAYVRQNGTNLLVAEGYGTNVTISRDVELVLYAGDVITLAVKSFQTTAQIISSSHSDTYLTVEAINNDTVSPCLVGWTKEDPDGLSGLRDINGMNLWSTSWDLRAPLGNGTDPFEAWAAANRDRACDIACSFVPHKGGGNGTIDQQLDAVVTGTRDDALAALGVALATYGTDTVFARPFWEPNIFTFTISKFVTAWNYAIPKIKSAFAAAARPGQTLSIVFCFGGEVGDPDPWWPGSANVDVISVDTYGKKYGSATPTKAQVIKQMRNDLDYLCAMGAKYGKQIAISEWANWAIYTDGGTHSYGLGDEPDVVDFVFDRIESSGIIYAQWWNTAGGVNDVGQTLADIPLSRARLQARRALASKRF